jgi:surface antigen
VVLHGAAIAENSSNIGPGQLTCPKRVTTAPYSLNQIPVRHPQLSAADAKCFVENYMKNGITLMATAAALLATALPVLGQRYSAYRDPDRYYSEFDQAGQYRPSGRDRDMKTRPDWSDHRDWGAGTRYDKSVNHYRHGEYEQSCRQGNVVAGTIFGAAAGGLVGSAVSHGNGGAVVGGAVLGGLLGNTVSKDIDCDDQPYAFSTYSEGLNGDVGRRYDWNHGQSRGYFQPMREYRRSGIQCRDFTVTTYRGKRELTHDGTACRASDGQWRFD